MLVLSRLNEFIHDSNKEERYKFSQVFILLFSLFFVEINKLPLYFSSPSVVEQWSNVLPNLFMGKQDFLFSYGPLYWLNGSAVVQYSELTYWLSVIFISAYAAASWAILIRLSVTYRYVCLLAVIYLVIIKSFDVSAIYFTSTFFIIMYFRSIGKEYFFDNKLFLLSLAILVSFLFYLRFFYGMVALLTLGSYLFSTRILKKKFSSMFFFLASTVIIFLLFGFSIFKSAHGVIDYTLINSQLNYGNSVDMNYDVQLSLMSYVIVLMVFLVFNLYLYKSQAEMLLTVNGLLLIFYKIGFSRADHYISYFIVPTSLLALVFSANLKGGKRIPTIIIIVLVFLLGSISIYEGAPKLSVFAKHEDFSKTFVDRAAARYPDFKLPEDIVSLIGTDTIDVYPYNNEYFIANKLNYHHRPSFQNYMTLTPNLDKMNVSFLSKKDAPEFILWTGSAACASTNCEAFNDFDDKYVLNEDPLTSMAIISNYHVLKVFSDAKGKPLMLLRKRESVVKTTRDEIGNINVKFNEWIEVPNATSGIVKLKPELKLTLAAKLQNMLYHGGVLYINYKLSSGEIKRFRQNIINAQSGIWISPWLDAFPLRGQRVVEIMFETPSKNYFKDDFHAVWEIYSIPDVEYDDRKILSLSSNRPVGLNLVSNDCDASMDKIKLLHVKLNGQINTNLRVFGWAAYSVKDNVAAWGRWLTLTDSHGEQFFVPLNAIPRPDVANYFQKSALVNSGFDEIVSLNQFKGTYKLGMVISGDGKFINCTNFAEPIIIK